MARTTNDFTALARLWKDRRSSVALVYERRMGEDPGPTLQRWVDWVRSTYPEQVGINGVTRMTASQWLLTFSSIDSRELFVELLRALAETADLSATGRLRPLRQTRPTEAVLNTPWMNTTVVISLPLTSGWSNTPRGRRGGRLLEFVKDESISELLAFAGRWVSAVAPEPHVVTMGVEFPVDAGSVEEVLQALWSTREDAIVILADGRPDRARALHITDSAQCILQ